MKYRYLTLAILNGSLLALPTFAAIFGGSFTQTVTSSSNNSSYQVGDVFWGYYRYESATIDGDFFTTVSAPLGTNDSLYGEFYFAHVARPGDSPLVGLQSLNSTNIGGSLKVSGGQVIEFSWAYDVGGYSITAQYSNSQNSFVADSYYDRPIYDPTSSQFLPTPSVIGILSFGSVQVVPDRVSVVWTVGFCISGLGWLAGRKTRLRGGIERASPVASHG